MSQTIRLEKFSIGVGDRFALEAPAQLAAFQLLDQHGVQAVPVWNKSNREHITIGSEPSSVRQAADSAVRELNWTASYYVDADHIRLDTVDRFIPHSDFFTIDVADSIGQAPKPEELDQFILNHPELTGNIAVAAIDQPLQLTADDVRRIASKYLKAVRDAGALYRHIAKSKGDGAFVTEVSMDETDSPQTPPELLVILAAMADEKIPAQTIAPKFTGRFNKGVDYAGDINQFEQEFNDDLAVIAHAIEQYGLPSNLKLSVHSGSDKFSIYAPIARALERFDAGVHLKTAGTTWLEELIGLAEAGGDGLNLAKEIYAEALDHLDELCAPYASVIDIDPSQLPSGADVNQWTAQDFAQTLRHDQTNPRFNPHVRQLLHVGYKIAAKKGTTYLDMLKACRDSVHRNVTENLFDRHLKPLFL